MVSSRSSETTNYQTSRTVTRMGLERGVVQRLSVAVLVDSKSRYDEASGEVIREPRTAEEMAVLRQLAIAAAGIVEQRGDLLTVESLPFTILDPPPAPLAVRPPGFELSLDMLKQYRYELMGVGALLLLLLVGLVLFLRRGKKRAIAVPHELTAEEARKELEAAQREASQRDAEKAVMLKGLKMASLQSTKGQALKKHLDETARKDPAPIVELLRTWVHEDDK
jgi:flagellar M-ring protein FliF